MSYSREILSADGWILLCFPYLHLARCRVETLHLENLGHSNPRSHSPSSCYDLIPYHLGLCLPIPWSSKAALCSHSSLKGTACVVNSVLISVLETTCMVSISFQLLNHYVVLIKFCILKLSASFLLNLLLYLNFSTVF